MMWTFVFVLLATFSPAVFGTLVGGRTPVDLNKDKRAQEALKFAEPELTKWNDTMLLCAPQQDIKVEKQVVEGIMYHFTVRMVKASFSKTPALHHCPIPISANSETYKCTFEVWSRPWLKNKLDRLQLLHPKCQKEN
ncbi:cystatin-C-like [Cheilinus undulatus]|uniref:cystatin-C-like n=1 Tax=Cheilinus undulatus TaxID=241271 RepID=UPI001BD4A4D5|nr:cystatin-C-like [Cheilinus undulatus]